MITRPPIKQDEIINDLRGKIIGRVYEPGKQLPTRTDFEEVYQASRATVQRALDQLASDGFVVARGQAGTYV